MAGELSRDGSAEATSSRAPWRRSVTNHQNHPETELSSQTSRYRDIARRVSFLAPAVTDTVDRRRSSSMFMVNVPPSLHSMLAGAGAGLISSIATCPLDVVKTTLQAQNARRGSPGYEGVVKTCVRIYKQNGVRGFYRGLGPTIAGYLPTWAIYFTAYDWIKDRLKEMPQANAHPDISHVFAASMAGATGTVLTNPLWVVKTRFMAQAILPKSAPRYRTTLDAVRTIYRNEGFGAFYKGLLPSLLGVSHVAIQFGLYEKCKALAAREREGPLTPGAILLCSSFSKMVASLVTYPHEVLRTRIQVSKNARPEKPPHVKGPHGRHELYSPLVTGSNPPVSHAHEATEAAHHSTTHKWKPRKGGIIDVFRKIYRQDGWRGFYRGLSINLLRTVPSSAVTMLTYELIMRNLALGSRTEEECERTAER